MDPDFLRITYYYREVEICAGIFVFKGHQLVDLRKLWVVTGMPHIILNYAFLLEENSYFEDALKVYERGVKKFKYPHVKDKVWLICRRKNKELNKAGFPENEMTSLEKQAAHDPNVCHSYTKRWWKATRVCELRSHLKVR
ncbi:unnamed protein product [Brassica oleracea]